MLYLSRIWRTDTVTAASEGMENKLFLSKLWLLECKVLVAGELVAVLEGGRLVAVLVSGELTAVVVAAAGSFGTRSFQEPLDRRLGWRPTDALVVVTGDDNASECQLKLLIMVPIVQGVSLSLPDLLL